MSAEKRRIITPQAQTGLEKLAEIENALNKQYVRYQTPIRAMVLAILTKEHVMLLSDGGAAKTEIATKIFQYMEGPVFRHDCGIDDNPSSYFGMIDGAHRERTGEIKRIGKDFIQETVWAILDELFDAPDQILRKLLRALNEREFKETDNTTKEANLRTAVATSNYTRLNPVTGPLLDRFMLQAQVDDDLRPEDRLEINLRDKNGAFQRKPEKDEILTTEELDATHEVLKQIATPTHIIYLSNLVIETFLNKVKVKMREGERNRKTREYKFSGRREKKKRKMLQAAALMAGRKEITREDLYVLPLIAGGAVENINLKELMLTAVRETLQRFSSQKAEAQLTMIGSLIDQTPLGPNAKKIKERAGLSEGWLAGFLRRQNDLASLREEVEQLEPEQKDIDFLKKRALYGHKEPKSEPWLTPFTQ